MVIIVTMDKFIWNQDQELLMDQPLMQVIPLVVEYTFLIKPFSLQKMERI